MIEAQCLIPRLREVNGSPEKLEYLMQDSLLNVFAPSEPGFFDRQNNSADDAYGSFLDIPSPLRLRPNCNLLMYAGILPTLGVCQGSKARDLGNT